MSDIEDRQMALDLPENTAAAALPLSAELDEAFIPVLNKEDEILVLDEGFDFDGFQVVRAKFLRCVRAGNMSGIRSYGPACPRESVSPSRSHASCFMRRLYR